MIKGIIFDVDDTLYQFTPANEAGLKASYTTFKAIVPIPYEEFSDLYYKHRLIIEKKLGQTAATHDRTLTFTAMIESFGGPFDSLLTLKLLDVYWKAFISTMKLDTDTKKVLKWIADQDIPMGIVTDMLSQVQYTKLKKFGISSYFDSIVTSQETGHDKPHKSNFMLISKKMGIAPKNLIMVGDNLHRDVLGAKSVGMKTVHIKRVTSTKAKVKADYTIKKLSELIKIISDEQGTK
ncbi:MAG: HAD superfamily hydrolase (TIGR01549 family) [Candidatus Woesearchaeota archaeon]|jgi:HAD superfamily hydrolase (TIGR01549 family)